METSRIGQSRSNSQANPDRASEAAKRREDDRRQGLPGTSSATSGTTGAAAVFAAGRARTAVAVRAISVVQNAGRCMTWSCRR